MAPTPYVPIATWIAPFGIDSQRPPGRRATSITAASSTSIVTTTSRPAQRFSTVSANRAPALTKSSPAARTTSWTTSSCPPPRRRCAIPRPIRPRPMNPIFMRFSAALKGAALLEATGARLLASEHRPVLVAVPVGDGAHEPVADHAAARERDVDELGGRECELDVLQPQLRREPGLVVRRVDHQLAVDLV